MNIYSIKLNYFLKASDFCMYQCGSTRWTFLNNNCILIDGNMYEQIEIKMTAITIH